MNTDRFFLNCNDGISPARVAALVKKWGQNILIGIDPGMTDRPSDDTEETIAAVKKHGAKLHVYLVGPGMLSWSKEEAAQVKFLAKSVGIDTTEKNWHDEWKESGWEEKAFEQFSYYFNEHNAYSCEIDNLDSSSMQGDFDSYVAFFKRFAKKLRANNITTKFMLKNIEPDDLRRLQKEIENGSIPRDFFCEYGMFEEGSGSPKEQIAVCKAMGIYAATPISGITDTYNYGVVAEGVPSIKSTTVVKKEIVAAPVATNNLPTDNEGILALINKMMEALEALKAVVERKL